MTQLASDLQANPPLVGSFKPTKGTIFIAKFTDGCWYRAKAERFEGSKVHVIYVDYGNVSSLILGKGFHVLVKGFPFTYICGPDITRI